jgi:integrase
MAIILSDFLKTKHPGLKIHKNGLTFLLDIRVNDKRYRKVWNANPSHTKSDRLKTAYFQLEVFRDEVARRDDDAELKMNSTINEGWELLKSHKEKVWSDKHTYKMNNFYERYLKNSIGKRKIRDIKSSTLNTFNRTISHLSTRSQKTAYEILTPIFALAVDDNIIVKTPIKKSHRPVRKASEEKRIIVDAVPKYKAVHKAIHQLFGSDDLIKINDTTEIQCQNNPHHRALFLFGFYGRRYTETLNLKWEDINFDAMSYIVRKEHSKVNTDMEFTLSQDTADALREFQETSGPIFHIKKVDKWFAKIRTLSGINEFTYHWMRNLSVSALSAKGVEITHLSGMLGHTDSSTIRQYLSLQRKASTAVTNEVAQKLLS